MAPAAADPQQQHIAHLNAVLRSIRGVNLLINHEKDRDRLLQRCCAVLAGNRGYAAVRMWALDDAGSVVSAAEAGRPDALGGPARPLPGNVLPACTRAALDTGSAVVLRAGSASCDGCPSSACREDAAVVVALRHERRVLGLLAALVPADRADDTDERALFEEVAGDLAFALHDLELAAQHRQAEDALRDMARVPAENPYPVLRLGPDGTIRYANPAGEPLLQSWGCAVGDAVPVFWRSAADRALADGRPRTVETTVAGRVLSVTVTPVAPEGCVNLYGADVTERMRAELALAQREHHLSAILRTAQDGFWMADLEGHLLEVNDAYCALSGYSRAELLGMRIADVEVDEDPEAVLAHIRAIRDEGAHRFETRHRRKDGRVVDVEVSARHLDLVGGRIVVFLRDVTARKAAEREREVTVRLLDVLNSTRDLQGMLREVTRLLREWTGCAAVGVRLKEGDDYPYYETRGFPASFVQAENSLCRREDGVVVRDASGNPVLDCMCGNVLCGRFNPAKPFFTPRGSFWSNGTTALLATTTPADRLARTRNRCNGEGYESVALVAIRTGATTHGLLQFNDPRPDRFTAEGIGLLERMADHVANALSARRSQENLALSEERYRRLFENGNDAILVHPFTLEDGPGRFLEVNGIACRSLGYTREEMLQRSPYDIDGTLDRETGRLRTQQIVQGGSAIFEAVHVARDGRRIPVEVNAHVLDLHGQPVIMAVARDLSDSRRAAEEKRQLENRLLQAQKLESIGTLAGGVAHEINNPVMIISNYAELIGDRAGADGQIREFAQAIDREAERVSIIVRDLLRFARQDAQAEPEPARLHEIVQGTLTLVRTILRHDQITLDVDVPADLPPVPCRGQQIQQVLTNLLTNARDALNQRYAGQHADKRIAVRACAHVAEGRPRVRLTVEDRGTGIPADVRERLFEPFFTTKPAGKGTGLGLSISYGIVTAHGGIISVESEEGAWTRFHVDLPAME